MLRTCCFSHGLLPYTPIINGFGQALSCEDVCLEGPALQRGLESAVLQAENSHPALYEQSWALEVPDQTVLVYSKICEVLHDTNKELSRRRDYTIFVMAGE